MVDIQRNQLAELIAKDGQPVKAIEAYLREAMMLLENFDCVTNYNTTQKTPPLTSNKPNLKLTKELFLNSVYAAYEQLKKINLEDLYLNLNFINDSDSEYFDEDYNPESVGYYLSTIENDRNSSDFLIVFTEKSGISPVIAGIEVIYYTEELEVNSDKVKFVKTGKENEQIFFNINGTNGDGTIEYKEENVLNIIPINKIVS